jgi:antitoxin (DNA-binding transcriptional repressor) of toxin-antitoxin stability system
VGRRTALSKGVDLVYFLVNNTTKINVNIHDAKTNLSRYLERAAAGEVIVVCRRNVPIAEIRALQQRPTEPRPVGLVKGYSVPDTFFEPLPDALLDAFEGDG